MYPCVALGALSVTSATCSEALIAELIQKVETGAWNDVAAWTSSLNRQGDQARKAASSSAHELHMAGVAVRHVSGIDNCSVRDIHDVCG
jgi:hypothetical protein